MTERVPRRKKVIELLLPYSFCGTLNFPGASKNSRKLFSKIIWDSYSHSLLDSLSGPVLRDTVRYRETILVIFFPYRSPSPRPHPDPTPTPPRPPPNGPETDPKWTRNRPKTDPKRSQRSRAEPKWTENQGFRGGTGGPGGFVGMGGLGGCKGKRKSLYYLSNTPLLRAMRLWGLCFLNMANWVRYPLLLF